MVDIYVTQEKVDILTPESRFRFNCHAGLGCYKQCCQKPTIILKPYDIVRLKRRLGISSTEFLGRYTIEVLEEKSQLPLLMLDIEGEEGIGCPFLEAEGCGVYEDRPGACRLFPVILGSSLGPEGVVDRFFLKRLEFCQGFTEGREWTLSQWQADQGVGPDDEFNREWLEIMLKRGATKAGAEDARASAWFSMAAYDLDRFRRHIFTTPFLEIYEIPEKAATVLQESDVALLRFGYKFLKLVLLLEDPAQMKEEMRGTGGTRRIF